MSDARVCRSKLFAKSQSIILQCHKTDRIPALIVKYCRNEKRRVASLLPADDMPPKWWENTVFINNNCFIYIVGLVSGVRETCRYHAGKTPKTKTKKFTRQGPLHMRGPIS